MDGLSKMVTLVVTTYVVGFFVGMDDIKSADTGL